MSITRIPRIFKTASKNFYRDDGTMLGAALAYYAVLSLAPALIILVSTTGFLGEENQQKLIQEIKKVVAPQAYGAVETVINSAAQKRLQATISAILGFAIMLTSATGAFHQLQNAINKIWHVRVRPGCGLKSWARKRLLSLGMVVDIVLLLIASVAVNTVLAIFIHEGGAIWHYLNIGVSVGMFAVLYAGIFKFLPDVRTAWRDVWMGAIITAILFVGANYLLGLYFAHSGAASIYGAAGSLVVLLMWIYFSGMILFFGAEITQACSSVAGRNPQPLAHAMWINQAPAKKKP